MRTSLTVALLLVLLAPASWAQRVTGVVVSAEDAAPVAGVVITLLDERDQTRAGTLSDGQGGFLLAAPGPGSYRLKAERIGFETAFSSHLQLLAAGSIEHRLVLTPAAVALDGIAVRASRRCQIRPDAGPETQRVWEQARRALSAVALTESLSFVRFDIRTFERELDRSGRVLAERTSTRQVLNDYPFRSSPGADLMGAGFVQQVRDSIVYHAPDAHVLLSDEFLEGHCFSVRRSGERPGSIGLAFEPTPLRRHIPGVAGVLWLDEQTAELRQMEYRYTRFPPAHRTRFFAADPSTFGGTLHFERLENGAWIVSEWTLITPVPQVAQLSRRVTSPVSRETGGQVGVIQQPGTARQLTQRDGSILGRVLDADDRTPVAGAVVYISGTQHRATSGTAGEFRMAEMREGRYQLTMFDPAYPMDPDRVPSRDVEIRAGEDATVELFRPGLTAQLRMLCTERGGGTGALLAGYVRDDATGLVLPGARVELRSSMGDGEGRRAVTDSQGRYHFCDLQRGASYQVRATVAARGSAERELTVMPQGDLRGDLAIDLRTPLRVTGRVLDAESRRPVAAARVRVTGSTTLTDAQGRFLIENVPAGTHQVEVEHLGYGTHREAVSLRGAETLDFIIHLGIRAIEIEGVVATVRARPPPGLADFHRRMAEQRGGHFLDRAAIERRNATRVDHLLAEHGFVVNNYGVITPRGASEFGLCGPAVYIDGIRVTNTASGDGRGSVSPADARDALRMINPSLLDGVELYRGASQLPAELGGTGGGCGVVMLWTRRGS